MLPSILGEYPLIVETNLYQNTKLSYHSISRNWQPVYLADIHKQVLLETEEFSCSECEEFDEVSLGFNTLWYCTLHKFNYYFFEFYHERQIFIMINYIKEGNDLEN